MAHEAVNPEPGKVDQTFPELTDEEVAAAGATAHAVYAAGWWLRPVAEHARIVGAAGAKLRQKETKGDKVANATLLGLGLSVSRRSRSRERVGTPQSVVKQGG